MKRLFYVLLSVLIFLLGVTVQISNAATIDFENFDLKGAESQYVDNPLNFNDVGGSGVDVTITGGAILRIYDLPKFSSDAEGYYDQALIDWFWPNGSNSTGTTISFSSPVSAFSLLAGDFAGDNDVQLIISAFDSTNSLLGTDSVGWDATATVPDWPTLSIDLSGISSIVYSSGGQYDGSTFIDDITFTPDTSLIPIPGAIWLLGSGLIGIVGIRRKFKK